ncbi:MAG TPA: alpha/beta hydrolase [Gaiellaceae bacterium]|nr:alpha/beta hydrolase [Gaiellaceae bacterium]
MLLHVHEWGDPQGEPIVCLHGVTGYAGVFQRLAEERWNTRRVLAFDLRGHGRSGWEPPWTFATHVADLAETSAALGLPAADWVGHSFGGRLILELAAVQPQLVRRAALLDPAIQVLPDVALAVAELERREPVYASVEDYVQERLLVYPDSPRAAMEHEAAQHLELQRDGSFRRRTCQAAAVSIYGELASAPPSPSTLAAETVLLHAPAYGLVHADQIEAYRAALGDRLRVVEVRGMHMVQWDALDEVAEAVEQLLARAID